MKDLQLNFRKNKLEQSNYDQNDICNNIKQNLNNFDHKSEYSNIDININKDIFDNLNIAKFDSEDHFKKIIYDNINYQLLENSIFPFDLKKLKVSNFLLVFWCDKEYSSHLEKLFIYFNNYFKIENIKKTLEDNEEKYFNLGSLQYVWSDVPYYSEINEDCINNQEISNFMKETYDWNNKYHNVHLHVSCLNKNNNLYEEVINLEEFPYLIHVIEKSNCNDNIILWARKELYEENNFREIGCYYDKIISKQNNTIHGLIEKDKKNEKEIVELYLKSYIFPNKKLEDKKNHFIEKDEKIILNHENIHHEFDLLKRSDLNDIDESFNIDTLERFIKIYKSDFKNIDNSFKKVLLDTDNVYVNTYVNFIIFIIHNLVDESKYNLFCLKNIISNNIPVFFEDKNLNDILNNINSFFHKNNNYNTNIIKNLKFFSFKLLSLIKFILNKANINQYKESFNNFKNEIKNINNDLIQNGLIYLDDYIHGNDFNFSFNIEIWFENIKKANINSVVINTPFENYITNDINFIKNNFEFNEIKNNTLPSLCKNLIKFDDCIDIINGNQCSHLHPECIKEINIKKRTEYRKFSISLNDKNNDEYEIYDNRLSPLIKEKIDEYFINNKKNINFYYTNKSLKNIMVSIRFDRTKKFKKYSIEKKNKETIPINNNLINSVIDKIMEYDKNIDINRYNSNVKICPNVNAKGFCDTNNCENFHPKKILLNVLKKEYQNFCKNNNNNNKPYKFFILKEKQKEFLEAMKICNLIKEYHSNNN